jgi:predicted GTPase/uncharacterized protein (DUF697 family)
MRSRLAITAAVLIAIVIAGGVVLRYGPTLVEQYQKAVAQHPAWGDVYLAIAGAVAIAFLVLSLGTIWVLWSNTRRKMIQRVRQARAPSEMSRGEQEREIAERFAEVGVLAGDASVAAESREPVRQATARLEAKQQAQTLELVAFGTVSSGKSSLLNALAGSDLFRTDPKGGTTIQRNEIPWPGVDRVFLVDTPGLAEIGGDQRETLARQAARDADLVLFVVDGPLKDFEHRLLAQLGDMEKRILVCVNKQDWFRTEERRLLTDQIAAQVKQFVPREDVILISAQPAVRPRVRVLADGSEVEETVAAPADISPLAERMMQIVEQDGRDLLLANLLMRSRGLVAEAKRQVQTSLDRKANEVVDRAMWQAGGAAALSPFPMLDVAAGLAVSSKMVFDLARVYRQPIDLEAAGRLVGELGKNLLAILGASVATPAIGTAVASALKTVPGVGTLAGGALQGVVQALVTRWIGRVFIEYFRNEMAEPELGWAAVARAKWNEVTRPAELAKIAQSVLRGNSK